MILHQPPPLPQPAQRRPTPRVQTQQTSKLTWVVLLLSVPVLLWWFHIAEQSGAHPFANPNSKGTLNAEVQLVADTLLVKNGEPRLLGDHDLPE